MKNMLKRAQKKIGKNFVTISLRARKFKKVQAKKIREVK